MRRGSTSRSQISAGSARPCSGTSTSRRRSIPAPADGWRSTPCQAGRKAASAAGRPARSPCAARPARRGAGGAAPRRRTTRRSRAAGAQLAAHDVAVALELAQHGAGVDAVALAQLVGRERPVRPRVARDEHTQRVGHVGEERLGQPAGRRGRQRVAVEPGLVGCHPARLAADAQADRAAFALQLGEQRRRVDALEHALGDLLVAEVADVAQHVVQAVAAGRARDLGAVLQVILHTRERVGVEQLAQLLLAEQLAQQVTVERQRGGAALGARRVALVHVRGDVVEQQRGGKRRGRRRLDLDERDLARVQPAQQLLQPGHVEHVAQALAVGLEHDREVGVAARDLEQVLRLQALLPQRRASAGVGARDQQRARGVLAKARAEQRRAAELGRDRSSTSLGLEHDQLGGRGQRLGVVGVEVGQVQHDAVVGPDRVGLDADALADARGRCASPQAACTRPPNGESTHSRQSPISSRKRSSTIVRSLGSTRVASCCSRR